MSSRDAAALLRRGQMTSSLANANMQMLNGSSHTDCLLLFSELETLHNICTSWMGSAVWNDWQLSEHFLKICPPFIRAAWIEYENRPENRIKRLSLSLSEFKTKMQSVWNSALNKQRLTQKFSQSSRALQPPEHTGSVLGESAIVTQIARF